MLLCLSMIFISSLNCLIYNISPHILITLYMFLVIAICLYYKNNTCHLWNTCYGKGTNYKNFAYFVIFIPYTNGNSYIHSTDESTEANRCLNMHSKAKYLLINRKNESGSGVEALCHYFILPLLCYVFVFLLHLCF